MSLSRNRARSNRGCSCLRRLLKSSAMSRLSLPVGQVVIPHRNPIEPLSALRNTLLQSSLTKLRECGFYERYLQHVDPAVLDELSSNLAPGWVRIALAEAHYAACDAMALSDEELTSVGMGVGTRVRETSIVMPGKKSPDQKVDVWPVTPQLFRVWSRLYQGGSVQVSQLGPSEELLEFRGFTLNRYRYYRHANVAAIVGAHQAVGVLIQSARLVHYDATTHATMIRLAWG